MTKFNLLLLIYVFSCLCYKILVGGYRTYGMHMFRRSVLRERIACVRVYIGSPQKGNIIRSITIDRVLVLVPLSV